ncbi:MAG: hypothetical protein LAT64_06190 [Phycisphaerales bacterium]|nr:hypothetical protein [Planctomycetota bacterium]MCH8508344.1 hypothetical protein [Phycisphaerales bacterium]
MTTQTTQPPFFEHAERIVRPLCDALRELVQTQGHGIRSDLAIHPTLRSRVTRGLESDHLPTVLYHLPGADGLRRLADACEQEGVEPVSLRRCRGLIDDYERFLRDEQVNRDALHAMVGDLAPEARQSVVRTNAQAAHKAMANLIGYRAEAMVAAIFMLPGATPGRCDLAQVCGFSGLQRLRANAWFMTSGYGRTEGEAGVAKTLSGEPVRGPGPGTLLEPFCSDPPPRFNAEHQGRRLVYRLEERDLSLRSGVSFFFGERITDAYPDPPEHTHDSPARAMISTIIATPSKRLHFDVFVHRAVWQDCTPRLDTYRTVPHGPVSEDSVPERACDRIDLGATLQTFPTSSRLPGAARIPRYSEMIRHAVERMGVDPADLRLHRCESIYPLHGTQYAVRFERDA